MFPTSYSTALPLFLLLYKRLKVTSSHELSGKTVICSGMQCRLQVLEGLFLLEISQSTARGLIARGWKVATGFCSSSEPSPPTVALLCIEDYWLSAPNPMLECSGQKKKKLYYIQIDSYLKSLTEIYISELVFCSLGKPDSCIVRDCYNKMKKWASVNH